MPQTFQNTEQHTGAFIISSGRCGSTLMSHLVREHPDILSLSEVFACLAPRIFIYRQLDGKQFWRLLSESTTAIKKALNAEKCPDEFLYPLGPDAAFTNDTLPPILRATLPFISDDPDALYFRLQPVIEARPKAPLADQYRFLFDWLTDHCGKKVWIERSGASLPWTRPIRQHFPDARFVHIYRDGRDVALSINNHPGVRAFAHNWTRFNKIGIDLMRPPVHMGSSWLLGMAEPAVQKIVNLEKQLDTPLSLTDIGKFWSAMVKVGLEQLALVPIERKLSICYEELVVEPEPILRAFIRFFDPALERDDWVARAAQLPQVRPSAWKELDAADQAALTKACAPGLELLGYSI